MELWENFILGFISFLIRKKMFSVLFWGDTGALVGPPSSGRDAGLDQSGQGSRERTTPLSQMTLMRSCTPLTPCGILVKSSLPIAFCLVVKGRWSDATMFRVSLGREKGVPSEGRRPGSQRVVTGTGKKVCASEPGKADFNLGSAT